MSKSLKEIYKTFAEIGPYGLTDKGTTHSYIDVYEELFVPFRDRDDLEIFEIGLGSGHSLLLWSEYFTKAKITGIDISLQVVAAVSAHPRISVIKGDATVPETLNKLGPFDLIIDDGSHRVHDQLGSFNLLYPRMRAGGVYFIEDIDSSQSIEKIRQGIPNCEILDLRNLKGRFDDVLAIIRK